MISLKQETKTDKLLSYAEYLFRDPTNFAMALYRWKQLSPKQRELLEMNSAINVVVAGRRFGKSSLIASRVLYFALTHPETVSLVAGPSYDQAKIYFDLLFNALEDHPFSVFVSRIRLSPFHEIKLFNSSIIYFRSAAQSGKHLRGRKVHFVALTEAAFISDQIFESVILPMRLDTQAQMFLESTPYGHNYFYRFYVQGLQDGQYIRSFHATVYDNYIIPREEIAKLRLQTPEYIWKLEYLAEFADEEGTVFTSDLLERVFEDYEMEHYKHGHKYVIGLDIAQKEDYTVFVVLDVSTSPYRLADFRRFNKRSYDDIIALANDLSSNYKAPVYMDATTVGRPIAEKIVNCVPITFSAKTKIDILNNLILAMEQKKVVLPTSNTILRDELRFFRWEHGSHYHIPSKAGQIGYHDDAVMALALAVWGATQNNTVKSFSVDWL